MDINFAQLKPGQFVEFCADLLKSTPGFKNISLGGSGPDLGCDIYAEEDWVTHSGYSETIRWLVQCRHFASSGRTVSSNEVGDIFSFLDEHNADGMFFITSTNVSGTAAKKLQEINRSRRHTFKARYWNRYELESRLLSTASHLVRKYSLSTSSSLNLGLDVDLIAGLRILIMPDMSIMSYQIIRRLQDLGVDVTIFSDFKSDFVRALAFHDYLSTRFDVLILFRAELFNYPVSKTARKLIEHHVDSGGGFIFTPWVAWTVNAGINSWIDPIVPVDVAKLDNRHFEHHEEDVFVRWSPVKDHPIAKDITSFDMRVTREFLTPRDGAQVIFCDSDENPAVVIDSHKRSRAVYINCCSHNCLRMDVMPSPFERNRQLEKLIFNAIAWAAWK